MKESVYSVKGKWPFPTDMLRYDRAVPASFHDEVAIRILSNMSPPDDDRLVWEGDALRMNTIYLKGPRPTEARWESFGWRVV